MTGRLVGVDLARTLALLGMFAAHLVTQEGDGPGGVSSLFQLVAGRSSALFAVLAGVSIALVAPLPAVRADPGGHRRRLLLRATLIAGLGLVLGLLDSGLAVILTNYGVLFCCALPVLAWRARSLAWLALAWGLLSPLASLALRTVLPEPTLAVPSVAGLLLAPVDLVTELLVTGYYPVLTWATYLFTGLAIGRLLQRTGPRPRVTRALVLGGGWLAILALAISRLITRSEQRRATLLESAGLGGTEWSALDQELRGGFYGTHPEGSAWWLGVWAPHSGSIVDLAHTTGSALLILGACLVLTRSTSSLPWAIMSGAGRATLTLYTAHVVLLATPLGDVGPWARDTQSGLLLHGAVALLAGAALVALHRRGPLEAAVRAAVTTIPVTPPPGRAPAP